jgi:glycosyltransferase involved in cell wall biosynthesis
MRTPLKICMVTTFYPPYHFGGDATYAYHLTEALAARGHQVDVIHSLDAYRLQHPAEPEVAFTHHANVTRYPLQTRWPLASALPAHQFGRPMFYARQLRAVLQERQPDVIHYHNISLIGGPGVLCYGCAVKLYTVHDYWLVCPTHLLFTFDREACTERHCVACTLHARRPLQGWRYTTRLQRSLRAVDRLLFPSMFALNWHRNAGLQAAMTHFPYFVPTPSPNPLPASCPLPERPFFLFAGRLEKLKGVQDLLQLFASYDRADLVIAGSGSYEAVLREQARRLSHVRFVGAMHPTELSTLYQKAVALLVPSLVYETFGLVVAEALSHGTPVIARRIGALREIVEQSGGGFLFRTLAECHQAMERLQADARLRAALGHRGQAAGRQYWSTEAHLDQYLRLLSSLIEEKKH